jgi:hypothetical protein
MATPAWSDSDMRALIGTASSIGANPADLLACMYFESGLDPTAQNPGGAYGLIQWTPAAYSMSGFSAKKDIPSTVAGQLPHVFSYLDNIRRNRKAVYANAGDIYQAIFAPGFFPSRSNDTVWYRAPSQNYEQNAALDHDGKGFITRGDAVASVASASRAKAFQDKLVQLRAVGKSNWTPDFGPGITPFTLTTKSKYTPTASFSLTSALIAGGLGYYLYKKFGVKW